MRWISWGSTFLLISVLASRAVGWDGDCGNAPPRANDAHSPCTNVACAAKAGYSCGTGCGTCTSPCCQKAWAGYCQEKAKWQAFWARLCESPQCCKRCCNGAALAPCGCAAPAAGETAAKPGGGLNAPSRALYRQPHETEPPTTPLPPLPQEESGRKDCRVAKAYGRQLAPPHARRSGERCQLGGRLPRDGEGFDGNQRRAVARPAGFEDAGEFHARRGRLVR